MTDELKEAVEFEPFGDEWEAEISKFTKKQLIEFLKTVSILRISETEAKERETARADENLKIANDAINLGEQQGKEWDRFWAAIGCGSEDVSVDDAIAKWKELEARADKAEAAILWRPMETAPRTGEHIQVINLDRFGFGMCGGKKQHASDVVHWFGDGFYCSTFGKDQDNPVDVYYTHWRPIEGGQAK